MNSHILNAKKKIKIPIKVFLFHLQELKCKMTLTPGTLNNRLSCHAISRI